MRLNEISWDKFRSLDVSEKGRYLLNEGREEHVLISQQFDRERLDYLGDLATRIRFIAKEEEGVRFLKSLLAHKRAMLYFTQPSTRTFLSFCAACQILGLPIGHVRDTATSSEFKGESQEDSIRTFSSYYDLIIMRSKRGGLAERMAWVLSNSERPVPIINAGSGSDQHPTQALLDIYTIQRSFEGKGGVDNKTILFVGDLKRGRTVRSLSCLLMNYDNVKQYFVAPDKLQVKQDVQDTLASRGIDLKLSDDLNSMIPDADIVYMTRIQDEWDKDEGESKSIDISRFGFGLEQLRLLKESGIVMHPLPRRTEISQEVDQDRRAMYWRQMRNGMWIRTALIAAMFGRDSAIRDYEPKNK